MSLGKRRWRLSATRGPCSNPRLISFLCGALAVLTLPTDLPAAVTVQGTVTDAAGAAVAEAQVAFTDAEVLELRASTVTDGDGHYSLTLQTPDDPATDVDEVGDAPLPRASTVHQNYPNPFNPTTVIPFELSEAGRVRLSVYNVLGQPVRTLVDAHEQAGRHEVQWDALDDRGIGVGAGVYIYRLQTDTRSLSCKMVLSDGAVAGTQSVYHEPEPRAKVAAAMATRLYTVSISGQGIISYLHKGVAVAGDSQLDFVVDLPSLTHAAAIQADAGGVVEAEDGAAIIIPEAVLEQDVEVVVSAVEEAVSAPDPPDAERVSLVYDFSAEQETFAEPVALVLPYSEARLPADASEAELYAATWDGASWVDEGGSVDPDANQVIVETDHLSLWTVLVGGLFGDDEDSVNEHEMVLVPAGPFEMGSDSGNYDERPVHTVELDRYYIDKYEVTNELYQAFVQASDREQPGFASDSDFNGAQQPVVGVSWYDAEAYCGWAGLRLPTEAEWEKAARGTDGRTYPWGEGIDADKANYGRKSGRAVAVGSYPAGVSPYGAHDMAGNVWEWVADRYSSDYYESSPARNPTGPSSDTGARVLRGGSFGFNPENLSASNRHFYIFSMMPRQGLSNIGFRCAQDDNPNGPANTAPKAEAGADQLGDQGELVTLDGSGSSDADGDALSYTWLEDATNPATGLLSDAEVASPTFTPTLEGTYRFVLSVSDGSVDSLPDTVEVVVVPFDGVAELPNRARMSFVWIEPGTFTMGSPSSEPGRHGREGPQHEVTITQGFWLGQYEITQGQWEAVMGTTPWAGRDYVRANASHPAVYISWDDVQAFVARLNEAAGSEVYRLPTEAEWEYACRAGTTTRWSFGDDEGDLSDYAWYSDNAWEAGLEYAQRVRTKRPNPWGLYDMHGNVYEWVQDWYGSYASEALVDPQGPSSGSSRVVRGGGFDGSAQYARAASRGYYSPGVRIYVGVGARLLRTE